MKVLPKKLLIFSLLELWLTGCHPTVAFSKIQGAIQIATNSFSPAEVDLLRAALLHNFNIESTRVVANKAKEQFIIRIPKREVPKVKKLVKPHIPSTYGLSGRALTVTGPLD